MSLSIPTTPTAPRPVRKGMKRRLAPGSVSAPRPVAWFLVKAPACRREIGFVEHVFRRKSGLDGKIATLRQKQDDADLQHQGDLMRGRPKQIVERRNACELAAEKIELLGDAGLLPCTDRLCAQTRREIARDDRRHQRKRTMRRRSPDRRS